MITHQYGICLLGVIPVRIEPSDRSEMVTQLLFGELFRIKEILPKWVKIELVYDNYEGWIDVKQYHTIAESEFHILSDRFSYVSQELISELIDEQGAKLLLAKGSNLPDESEFSVCGKTYRYYGNVLQNQQIDRKDIVETAMQYKGSPYLWGGRTPLGIDCSGFTQMVYKYNGIVLLRDAAQQITQTEPVDLLDEALAGDLLFFDNEDGRIIHVGIYLGENKIIHASGEVRVDAVDHEGIYNEEILKYTHHLRFIGRVM